MPSTHTVAARQDLKFFEGNSSAGSFYLLNSVIHATEKRNHMTQHYCGVINFAKVDIQYFYMGTFTVNQSSKKTAKTASSVRDERTKSCVSDKRRFMLTSVSKKELEDRRVPVYPYLL